MHDYQLQLVPKMLRAMRPDLRIGFFLHIPFPPQELFLQLPWRRPVLEGLLGADLVGFQVQGAASNFSRVARRLLGASGTDTVLDYDGRQVRVGAFPISVDTAALIKRASDPAVQARARQLRDELGSPEVVLLGVDRLDYTKGIDRRLIAIGELFADGSLTRSRAVLVQIAVPSREDDPHYRQEREHLEQLVGEVNGSYSTVGHPAVHYLYQSVELDELVALYLAADVMLVTPLRDGMNLVAKEYVASRVDASGALVLSEFTGAAQELRDAILVNPHDLDGLKTAIRHAVGLDPNEGTARMRRMRPRRETPRCPGVGEVVPRRPARRRRSRCGPARPRVKAEAVRLGARRAAAPLAWTGRRPLVQASISYLSGTFRASHSPLSGLAGTIRAEAKGAPDERSRP